MVGRDTQRAALSALLDERDGGLRVAIVEGEPGIGKSALLLDLVEAARQRGYRVVVGGADELERARSFGAFLRAFDLAPPAGSPQLVALGQRLAASRSEFAALDDLVESLLEVIGADPLLLALEDLHWADPATLSAIRRLIRLASGVPLLLVLTARLAPRSPELERVLEAAADVGATSLRLQPLSEAAVSTYAASVLGGVPGQGVLGQLAKAAGNPLFVGEVVRALEAEGVLHESAGVVDMTAANVPPSLQQAVLRRIAFLPPPVRDLLRHAAVLGDRFSFSDLAVVVGQPVTSLLPLLDEALAAGIVVPDSDHLAFRHDLIKEAVYNDLPASVRRAMHLAAARTLASTHAPAFRVAVQFALGAEPGDEQAFQSLITAADSVGHDPRAQLPHLTAARRLLLANDDRHDQLLVRLGFTHFLAGDFDTAAEVLRSVLAQRPEFRLEVAARFWLRNIALNLGSRAEAAELVADLRGRCEGWGPVAAALDLTEVEDLLFDGRRTEAAGLAAKCAATAEAAGDEEAQRDAETQLAVAELGWDVLHAVEVCRALGRDRRGRMPPRSVYFPDVPLVRGGLHTDPAAALLALTLARGLLRVDDAEEAERVLQTALREPPIPLLAAMVHEALASLYLTTGRWDDSVAEFQTAMSIVRDEGAPPVLFLDLTPPGLAIIALRRDELTAGMTEAAGAGSGGDNRFSPVHLRCWFAGLRAQAAGQLQVAAEHFLAGWRLVTENELSTDYLELGPDLVRALLAVGDREAARATAAEVVRVATGLPGVASARAASLLCSGLAEADAEAAVAGVAAYRQTPRAPEAARACEDAAGVVGRRDTAQAVSLLRDAAEWYGSVGAAWDLRRVEHQLRGLGVRTGTRRPQRRARTGWDALTTSERAVAELVADGLSNRQVADRLFVTSYTVATHLRHIFEKLDVRSRVELAAVVIRRRGEQDAADRQM